MRSLTPIKNVWRRVLKNQRDKTEKAVKSFDKRIDPCRIIRTIRGTLIQEGNRWVQKALGGKEVHNR